MYSLGFDSIKLLPVTFLYPANCGEQSLLMELCDAGAWAGRWAGGGGPPAEPGREKEGGAGTRRSQGGGLWRWAGEWWAVGRGVRRGRGPGRRQ